MFMKESNFDLLKLWYTYLSCLDLSNSIWHFSFRSTTILFQRHPMNTHSSYSKHIFQSLLKIALTLISSSCGLGWLESGWSGALLYFCRPPRTLSSLTPSLNIPVRRHFRKRQAWHAFLLRLFISHSLDAGHVYSIFPWKIM